MCLPWRASDGEACVQMIHFITVRKVDRTAKYFLIAEGTEDTAALPK